MTENKNDELTNNSEALVEGARADDEGFIEALLSEENADFDEKILENSDEGSIFHIAAKNNNVKIFRLFYKSFPELFSKVINNKIIVENNSEVTEKSILDIVIENGNIELLDFLLSQDDIEYDENLITHLIKGKIEPNKIKEIVSKYNIAKNIKLSTIDALLDLNDDYNNRVGQNTNYNLLNYAIDNDDFDGLKFLLTSNNDLYERRKFNDSFFYAWETSKRNIAERLINEPRLNVNEQDNEGNTLFHYAVLKNDFQLVKFLISRGIATDIENKQGLNPLGFLLENNKGNDITVIASVLADKNAVKSIRDNYIRENIQEMVNAQIRTSYTANNEQEEETTMEQNIKKLVKNYNSSSLGFLYSSELRPLLVDYYYEVDEKNDPIYLLLDGMDKILEQKDGENLEIWKKTEKICKKINEVKDNITKSFLGMKEEDFDALKKIFSVDEVKKKMNSLSNNLYEATVGDFFLNTIKDVELFKEKIRNVFAIEENETKIDSDKIKQLVFYNSKSRLYEVNTDTLMDLMPFNENNEIDMKRLTRIVDYAYGILNEDYFNTLTECLKTVFGWEPVFEINKTNLSKLIEFKENGNIKNITEARTIIDITDIILPEYESDELKAFIESRLLEDINKNFYDGFEHNISL